MLLLSLLLPLALHYADAEPEACRNDKHSLTESGIYKPIFTHSKVLGGHCRASDFELGSQIGSGGIGYVVAARHRPSGRRVAIKFTRHGATNKSAMFRIRREECNQHHMSSKYLAQLYCTIIKDDSVGLVMELVDGASLYDVIHNWHDVSGKVKERDEKKFVRQLFEALVVLHEAGIIFRDLKSRNIMVTQRGNIKVVDFGASARYFSSSSQPFFPKPADAARQHYRKQAFAAAIDWARLGIVMYEILNGELPFGDRKTPIHDAALNGRLAHRLRCSSKMNRDACNLFQHFVKDDWKERWGMTKRTQDKVRAHPWLRNTQHAKAGVEATSRVRRKALVAMNGTRLRRSRLWVAMDSCRE